MTYATARFDDLRPGHRRSVALEKPVAVIETGEAGSVPEVLSEVEAAVAGGLWAAGYVTYDAAPGFDPLLRVPEGSVPPAGPIAWFGLFPSVQTPQPLHEVAGSYELGPWTALHGTGPYRSTVEDIRRLIGAGEVYQVNFTTRLEASFAGSPLALYRDVALGQSGGYCAYVDPSADPVVVSASPELFFARSGQRVITRPMKGTAPRGRWAEEDDRWKEALEASEKDRAENLMIVDLLRNDLGRISEFGSVQVEDLFAVERIGTAWQMSSAITSQLRPEVGLSDVFGALFPCGSVTGAPKLRAMEIIADVEGASRGVYCGAVGLLSPPGSPGPDAAFSVAIRTVEIDRPRASARFGVGGGITWDSSPAAEHEEAAVKARVLHQPGAAFEVLETLRWDPIGGWWWREEHLARLATTCRYFSVPVDLPQARRLLDAAADGPTAQRVRLLVARDGSARVETAPAPEAGIPLRVAIDDRPVDRSDPFLYHKTTRRDLYEAARQRHPEAGDVLLVNDRDEITESTIANVIFRVGRRWVTPPIGAGCLPGVYRAELVREGAVQEAPVTIAMARAADEIVLVNSVQGRRPATLADIGAPPPAGGAE